MLGGGGNAPPRDDGTIGAGDGVEREALRSDPRRGDESGADAADERLAERRKMARASMRKKDRRRAQVERRLRPPRVRKEEGVSAYLQRFSFMFRN